MSETQYDTDELLEKAKELLRECAEREREEKRAVISKELADKIQS